MLDKNIVLIGLMGSGKSMVAQALHQRLGIPVFSTDALIEAKENCSIKDIFEQKGEAYFRGLEHEAVKELSAKKGVIIDCGGGVVLNPKNFTLLRINGIIFHLNADPEVIYARIQGDSKRPLINVPDPLARLREIALQRLPLYNQADCSIDANDPSIEGPVAQILSRMT